MRWGFVTCSLVIGLVSGCRPSSGSVGACVNDEQCQAEGVIGRCEVDTGLCVLPNTDCDSGWAYEASGKCAPPETGDGGNDGASTSTDSSGEEETESAGDGTIIDDFSNLPDMGVACGQEIGSCDKLDLLFVIDNSGSVNEDFESLIALANPDLLTEFIDEPCDVHVGVTFTDFDAPWQPEQCRVDGALSSSSFSTNGEPCYGEDHPPYYTTGDDLGDLFCALSGQTLGSSVGNERQFATIRAALGQAINAEGACNDGFLRDDAANLIILVTDEDDDDDTGKPGETPGRTGTGGFPTDWAVELAQLVDPKRTGIAMVSPLADTSCVWQPLPWGDDGVGGEVPQRLLLFNNTFGNANGYPDHVVAVELCQDPLDLADQLADVASELTSVVCEDSGL